MIPTSLLFVTTLLWGGYNHEIIRSHELSSTQQVVVSSTSTKPSDALKSKNTQVTSDPHIIQGIPVYIEIPSLSVSLPVARGEYDSLSTSWTLDSTQAFYATVSMPTNTEGGVTLIYGHAQATVFAMLPYIQPGAEVLIKTNNNYIFHYRYVSMRDVLPSDTSVFSSMGDPVLIVQTCTNEDVYRGLFKFSLESVSVDI